LIQGSSLLFQSLLAEGLIDEFTLLTFPVVLGRGKKLLPEGSVPGAYKLQEGKISGRGVAIARYAPDGPVTTGSFAQEAPSEAEIARRMRWQQEA
jgi:dihydrofolate reductase